MNTRNKTARKAGLVGAGIGLVLFLFVGLLYGSLLGGTMGLEIVNSVFHEAAGVTLLSRVIVAASMLAGVIVSGIVFVGLFSSIGWAAGYVVGAALEPSTSKLEAGKGRAN
jgi:hypothetical protein